MGKIVGIALAALFALTTLASTHKAGETRTIVLPGGATMELVWCPPGSFTMGGPCVEDGKVVNAKQLRGSRLKCFANSNRHRVTLTKGFWIGRCKVTQQQWESVMRSKPERTIVPLVRFTNANEPASPVTWIACQEFCRIAGRGLRLPTEAEWEYACRAGSNGAYAANAWGILDMQGGLAEWCADWWTPRDAVDETDPTGPASGDMRVIRIGGCRGSAIAYRIRNDARDPGRLGFRVCCSEVPLPVASSPLRRALDAGHTKTVVLPGGVPLELVWCPPGSFIMGSPASEPARRSDETSHRVTLAKGFWMGRYELTQRQWKSVMGSNPSGYKGDSRPVNAVSWDDCQTFCAKAGLGLRLPTEAEWEYACRAGSTTAYCWGDACSGCRANCRGGRPCGTSTKGFDMGLIVDVGLYEEYGKNAWGLCDMHGSVSEWCADRYGAYPSADASDPMGPASGGDRVYRGGNWCAPAQGCRSAARGREPPSVRSETLGVRVCCSAGPHDVSATEPGRVPPPPQEPRAATPPASSQSLRKAGEACTVTLPGGAKMEFVWCPPGAFTMGSPTSETVRDSDETQHRVTLTRGFWIGRYEVTQRQWESVMSINPSTPRYKGSREFPVNYVSWVDCQEFCRLAGMRLPTEAEWEYACRAGSTTAYSWGNALNGDQANCHGRYPCGTERRGAYKRGPVAVGTYAANAWGLYDMHGNVREWCADWYAEYAGDAVDPIGSYTSGHRVARGGGWLSPAMFCRAAYRHRIGADYIDRTLGFRVCCTEIPRTTPPAP